MILFRTNRLSTEGQIKGQDPHRMTSPNRFIAYARKQIPSNSRNSPVWLTPHGHTLLLKFICKNTFIMSNAQPAVKQRQQQRVHRTNPANDTLMMAMTFPSLKSSAEERVDSPLARTQ
ncbi:hypothetical protein TNCT_461491 [Trichonephila clavata]|uniref:Uncharacterized protein n=1 Tax=Trichonephila clavata TaxID=2740835 RepID=A0A8X6K836_TRICU|nr:hypothetical protein TNCT_461491 [Trichonephila clavata]